MLLDFVIFANPASCWDFTRLQVQDVTKKRPSWKTAMLVYLSISFGYIIPILGRILFWKDVAGAQIRLAYRILSRMFKICIHLGTTVPPTDESAKCWRERRNNYFGPRPILFLDFNFAAQDHG